MVVALYAYVLCWGFGGRKVSQCFFYDFLLLWICCFLGCDAHLRIVKIFNIATVIITIGRR